MFLDLLVPMWWWTPDKVEDSAPTMAAADLDGDGLPEVVVAVAELVFVFRGSDGGPYELPLWVLPRDGPATIATGDLDGDGIHDLVVARPEADDGAGLLSVYRGSPYGLEEPAAWSWPSPTAGAQLGAAVATADVDGDGFDDLIAGAPGANTVSLFLGGPSGLALAPPSVVEGPPGATLGARVANVGDLDADGYDDVALAAPGVFVRLMYGAAAGWGTPVDVVAKGSTELFGLGIGPAGDLDGDGFDDLAVGDPNAGIDRTGAVFIWFGGGSPPKDDPDASILGDPIAKLDAFGWALGSAGDANGDGFDDLMVGNPTPGRAAVYLSSPAGLPLEAAWLEVNVGVGVAIGPAVDLDGDGRAEVLVGDESDGSVLAYTPSCGLDDLDLDTDGIDDACDLCFGDNESGDRDADRKCATVFEGATFDCDDARADVFPGAPERCDGVDNSCRGVLLDYESDADGDGVWACAGDCDDADPTVSPAVYEECVEQDCNPETVPAPCADDEAEGPGGRLGCGCRTAQPPVLGWVALYLAWWVARRRGTVLRSLGGVR